MSTHLDADGQARMVDVSAKADSDRCAVAEGVIAMSPAVVEAIRHNRLQKGDALAVARVAAIMAVKKTPDAIPLCHTVPVAGCAVDFDIADEAIRVRCTVRCRANTGVEMEALHGVAVALLTLYDMGKSIDKGMVIGDIKLLRKTGGKSGEYQRPID